MPEVVPNEEFRLGGVGRYEKWPALGVGVERRVEQPGQSGTEILVTFTHHDSGAAARRALDEEAAHFREGIRARGSQYGSMFSSSELPNAHFCYGRDGSYYCQAAVGNFRFEVYARDLLAGEANRKYAINGTRAVTRYLEDLGG